MNVAQGCACDYGRAPFRAELIMQNFSDPGAQRHTAGMPSLDAPLYDLGRYQQV